MSSAAWNAGERGTEINGSTQVFTVDTRGGDEAGPVRIAIICTSVPTDIDRRIGWVDDNVCIAILTSVVAIGKGPVSTAARKVGVRGGSHANRSTKVFTVDAGGGDQAGPVRITIVCATVPTDIDRRIGWVDDNVCIAILTGVVAVGEGPVSSAARNVGERGTKIN